MKICKAQVDKVGPHAAAASVMVLYKAETLNTAIRKKSNKG